MIKQIFIFMNRRLWMRVIIPVTLILIAMVAGNLWFGISNQTKNGELQLKNQNDMLASAVEGGMFDALAIGDNDTVRTQFKRLNEKSSDLKVYVYDFNGIVSFSTDESSVGKDMNSLLDGDSAQDLEAMLKSGQDLEKSFHINLDGHPFLIKNDPVLNEQRCYHCHGSKRKVLGGISVFSSELSVRKAINKGNTISLIIQLSGLGIIILMVWLLFHHLVNKKVAMVLAATSDLRQKDFTHTYDIGQGDEINHILSRINLVTQDLRKTIQQVVNNSTQIFESASDLSQISESLDSSSHQASEKATTVSSAAEELNINNQSIAQAMDHSVESLNTVAAAVEQMSSTVEEIAINVNSSKEITQSVVEGFQTITQVVGDLGNRANDVDLVTDQIRSISGQVSMLALNAKVEAARAGEAGRGFAVVAQEITELASDTSRSTVEADEKLKWIKIKSKEISEQVEGIAMQVKESDDAISGISAAVEEQNATTSEIAHNINTVVSDISNVNTNVSEGATAASGIAKEITAVEEGSKEVQVSSHRLNENAASLSAMAEQFMELMKQFKV